MANSSTNLDLISAEQASKEITANALFDAGSPAALFGRRGSTTSALTWGYYGGKFRKSDKTLTTINNGSVALTASTTNYVEASIDGVVSVNTTGFTTGKLPLYIVVTGSTGVSSYTDERCLYYPMLGAAPINRVVEIADGDIFADGAILTGVAAISIATGVNTNSFFHLFSGLN